MMELLRGRLFKSVIMFGMAFIFAIAFGAVVSGVRPGAIFSGGGDWTLKVEGKKISVGAFQREYQRQSERAQELRQYGQDMDIAQETENALIQRSLLVRYARESGIVPTNTSSLAKAVKTNAHLNEAFQPYSRQFGAAEALNTFGDDQAIQGVVSSIQHLPIVTTSEIEADFIERNTKAKVKFIEFATSSLIPTITISDDEARKHYDAHKDDYWRGASVNFEFLRLDPAIARAQSTVSDEDVRAYYDSHLSEYEQDEVKAQHILRKFPPNPTPEQEEDVRRRMEEIVALAKKPDADFGALAAQYSEDPGSAAGGGHLGWFGRGQMVEPFEQAAFALNAPGEMSGIVKTVYGFHIIKLEEKRQGTKPFELVSAEIRNQLVSSSSSDKVREDADELFFDIDADGVEKSLAQDRYKGYGLTVQSTGFVSSSESTIPNLGSSWQYGDVLTRAFRARTGEWSEPIEVKPAGGTEIAAYVLLRVTGRKPAGPADFETVKESIVTSLKQQRALAMASEAAKQAWGQRREGEPLSALAARMKPDATTGKAPEVRESGEFATNQSGYVASMGTCRPAMVAAFQMNVGEVRGPFQGPTAVYLVELVSRTDADMTALTDAERANTRQRLLSAKQNALFQAWYQSLRDGAKIERNEKVLAQF
ncbi:hypothetical protein FJZ36_13520 [Candidatus Poribacteria bacterium]|nr:hypothetical protein [Candidatus Poribacteria bacterium]